MADRLLAIFYLPYCTIDLEQDKFLTAFNAHIFWDSMPARCMCYICVLEFESFFLKLKKNTGSTAAVQLSPHPF
jgi:hypothetical protein